MKFFDAIKKTVLKFIFSYNSKLILKIIFSIFIFLLMFFIVLSILLIHFVNPRATIKIEQYEKCLKSSLYKEKLTHFPKTIPTEAKNIKFYCQIADYLGGYELILLKFEIDKIYIGKELNSHSFLNYDTPIGRKQKLYNMPSELVGISPKNLTFYVLKGGFNENSEYFPYFSGIGISKDMNYILYYYINPE